MDFKSTIENLIAEFDINSELGSKKAYTMCLDYAKKNFKDPKEFNSFVSEAAKILDQPPIRKDVSAESTLSSGDEKLRLEYSNQNGPVLTGNKSGLLYLSRLLANLSNSEENGDHTHLYHDEFPMFGKTFPLTIYLENDFWFFKYANEPSETDNTAKLEYQKRDIDPNSIVAFVVFDNVPPTFPIIRGNIYKVQSCSKYKNQKVWVKGIKGESDKLYVFKFKDDNGVVNQFALDLDDPRVLFITQNDIEKLS